jgi:16S rRNA (cytosine967-C5)-methyltransferase
VRENLERLNLSALVKQGDGLKTKDWWDGTLFDRILLDAPCSATGVIRRNPDIKLLRTPEEISEITKTQEKLLHSLWPLLAPGGKMIYATCSIMPEENDEQIASFLEKQTDCRCLTEPKPWGHKTKNGLQILPGENNMDGFFYSVLIKDEV